jgi:hypothetical protein
VALHKVSINQSKELNKDVHAAEFRIQRSSNRIVENADIKNWSDRIKNKILNKKPVKWTTSYTIANLFNHQGERYEISTLILTETVSDRRLVPSFRFDSKIELQASEMEYRKNKQYSF